MPEKNFDAAVQSATAEASASRSELGCTYAAEFLKDPDKFDPGKLMLLGRAGLSSFVSTVGVPTLAMNAPPAQQDKLAKSESEEKPSGWEAKRAIPMPFELYGLLLGTFAGIAVALGCAAVLRL